ncbi:hypothetical protein D9B87_12140, partial [Corynebacterium diphtheriae]
TLSLTEFTAWMHRETPHNLVSDFSVRIMGSSSEKRTKTAPKLGQGLFLARFLVSKYFRRRPLST